MSSDYEEKVSTDPMQDAVDLIQSVSAGFGSRFAIGPYRDVTDIVRQFLADRKAGRADAIQRFQTAIGRTPNPQRACNIATIAVMMLPIINSFQPIPDYAEVLAALEALQATACNKPVPVPVPVPTPTV